MFKASIHVTLRPSILDPQGKAAHHALHNLGFDTIDRVRMGKFIEMWIDEPDAAAAERAARAACEKLLANPVMENFTVTVEQADVEHA